MNNIKLSKLTVYIFNAIALIAFFVLLFYSFTGKESPAFSFKNRDVMISLFVHTSYYIIFLILVIWSVLTFLFLKSISFSLKGLLKKHWPGILIAFILTSLVFLSVEVTFKTLSDETNLLAVSNSMLNDKTPINTTMGKYFYDNFNSTNNEIEKRPLVFPFLVSILHTVTGFRYQNPFVLNFIIMFLFLSGIYIAARQFLDIASSVAAQFLILSYPVFTIFGTSGGFDLLNSVFFIMILAAAYYFLKSPSLSAFAFIFASLLVFTHIRYESIFLLAVFPVLLLFTGKVKWHHLKAASWLFFITPLLTLPWLWQRLLKGNAYENPPGIAVFSFDSFLTNITLFFQNLIDSRYLLPYAGFLTIISLAIFLYLIVYAILKRKHLENWQITFLIVSALSVLLSTLIYFAHFFGNYTHPASARLFITLSIIMALGPVLLKIAKPQLLPGPGLLIFSVVCFLFYHPIAVENRFIHSQTGTRIAGHSMKFLSHVPDKNILIIASRPGQFTALGYGAVNFSKANSDQKQLLQEMTRHLYSKVFAFQEIEYSTSQPTKDTALAQAFKLKPLYEIQITATEFLRISEVSISDSAAEK